MPKGGENSKSQGNGENDSTPGMDQSWYESFLRQGVSEPAARTAATYIGNGMDPAVALHVVYSFGLDKGPESEWDKFSREQPIRANTKKLLNVGAAPVVDAGRAIAAPLPNPVHEKEKLSAAKMLKEYLMHQDAARAASQQKDAMWQQIHNAQVQDQFFTDNMRPPQTLADFAMAGMNYRPAAPPVEQAPYTAMPRLPGELAK